MFQFHKGTIKTLVNLPKDCVPLLFQFHKGTIKTHERLQVLRRPGGFNSIKVRLRLKIVEHANKALKFQFHKGTIKT